MNLDVLEMMNSTLGGPLIRQASAYLGESEESTRAAVKSVGPTMLAGLMQQATTPMGAAEIFRNVTDGRIDTGIAGKLAGLFGNRGNFESLLSTGESLTGMVFGGRTGNVTNAISQVSGVRPNSAMTLLSMGLPLLFGVLKKYVSQNGVNAATLGTLLLGQRRSLEHSGLDNRITNALGFGSVSELLGSLPTAGAAAAPVAQLVNGRDRKWVPWAVAAGVAVLGVLFFVNRTADRHDAQTGDAQVADSGGTTDRMKLASAEPTKVYFEAGDASIDPEDRRRIASLAESARQTDRPVAITGYTDRTGDADVNLELAKDRAYAVRDALVNEGVAEGRIVMDPPAFVTGSGTDEEARRVDIDVR